MPSLFNIRGSILQQGQIFHIMEKSPFIDTFQFDIATEISHHS